MTVPLIIVLLFIQQTVRFGGAAKGDSYTSFLSQTSPPTQSRTQLHNELPQWFPQAYASEADFVELQTLLNELRHFANQHFEPQENGDGVLNRNAKHAMPYSTVSLQFLQSNDLDERQTVSISVWQPGIQYQMTKYLFEGDILLTRPQAAYMLRSFTAAATRRVRVKRQAWRWLRRVKRKMYADPVGRWSEFPIHYSIHPSLDNVTIDRIHETIDFYEDNTCITFQQQTDAQGDYIEFFRGSGCYSMIGFLGGRQGISIGAGCERLGVISHELGHALGLWHEQSRPDADCCTTIEPQNIIRSMLSNFLTRSWTDVDTFDIPFDVGSDMHYGATAFTNDWTKFTITTKDADYQRTIGQREKLSFYDVQVLNAAYCNDTCKDTRLACKYGGYPRPSTCDSCICPEGLAGKLCDKVPDPKGAKCGGIVQASADWQNFTSPGYPQPGYKPDQECVWWLKAPVNHAIRLKFVDEWEFFCSTTCLDYVELKFAKNFTHSGKKFCCFDAPEHEFVSEMNEFLVRFRSGISREKGFKASFRYEQADGIINAETGKVESAMTTMATTTVASTTIGGSSPERERDPDLVLPGMLPTDDWTSWSPWSVCSRSCGGCGVRVRYRNCRQPTCQGRGTQLERCGFTACPARTTCSRLSFYDEPCGEHSINICSRVQPMSFTCDAADTCCPPFTQWGSECRVDFRDSTSWSQWAQWSACIGPDCGGCAVQMRHRVCNAAAGSQQACGLVFNQGVVDVMSSAMNLASCDEIHVIANLCEKTTVRPVNTGAAIDGRAFVTATINFRN